MSPWKSLTVILAASFALAVSAGAQAPSFLPPPGAPVQGGDLAVHGPDVAPIHAVTHHRVRIGGTDVAYTATMAEAYVPAVAGGPPAGVMVNAAYVREGVADPAHRPIIFLFNGGPGASSWMQFRGIGPRMFGEGVSPKMEDNPDSLLDVADLVFIDPVGTGLSRALPGHNVHEFWSSGSDAESVRAFIKAWLAESHREASPRYVWGESYGTTRAAELAAFEDLHLNGVVLLSCVEGGLGEDLGAVTMFPSFAATAAYHGRAPADGRTPQQVFDDNIAFARTRYAPALIAGSSLPPQERAAVADEMAKRLGLPVDLILQKNLRLSREDFMLNLLTDRGLRTGQLDARKTGDLAYYGRRVVAYNDPGMDVVMGPPRGRYAQPDDAQRPHAILPYLRDELGYPLATDANYIGLNFDLLFQFKHEREPPSAVSGVTRVMEKDARLRLLVAGGFYDLTTPLYASAYAVNHSGGVRSRIDLEEFAAGHESYEGDVRVFTDAVRRFLAGK
ncbi:MAG TPA: hypothetical protein VG407_08945 [Caulobacteraceae bacterium]|jgi:carboxypeptidase C (cathepsin A)|nr:hypothetical protein [Caulobacteraceae bacterium]